MFARPEKTPKPRSANPPLALADGFLPVGSRRAHMLARGSMPTDAVPGTSGRPATSASHAAAPAPAAPAPSVVVERPPPGLLRGKAPLPAPLLGAIGGVALVILLGFYFRKLTSRRSP